MDTVAAKKLYTGCVFYINGRRFIKVGFVGADYALMFHGWLNWVKGVYAGLGPSFDAMRAMPSWAVVLLLEPLLFLTTCHVNILGRGELLARLGVIVRAAVFFPTGPAPAAPTSLAWVEYIAVVQATGKNVVTCIVF